MKNIDDIQGKKRPYNNPGTVNNDGGMEVQKYAAEIVKDKAAAVCVMDIYNGDIITMASSPTFDPNAFVHGISKKDWNFLLNHRDKPMINKSLSEQFVAH